METRCKFNHVRICYSYILNILNMINKNKSVTIVKFVGNAIPMQRLRNCIIMTLL